MTKELAETMGYDVDAGVVITDVDAGSPAERAGFKRGLVISQLGRYPVTTSKQVEELLEPIGTGSVVDFTVGLVRTIGRREFVSWTPVTLTAR
jgi:serine protease Do